MFLKKSVGEDLLWASLSQAESSDLLQKSCSRKSTHPLHFIKMENCLPKGGGDKLKENSAHTV